MEENVIIKQLHAARSELKKIEIQISHWQRQRDIVQATVDAFDLSAKYLAEMQSQTDPVVQNQKRTRMPSSEWKRIFRELYDRYGSGFGYDQIIGVATSLGIKVKVASLRAKMMNLVDNGDVKRISDGKFVISEKGAERFDLLIVEGGQSGQDEANPSLAAKLPVAVPPTQDGGNAAPSEAGTDDVTNVTGALNPPSGT